MLRRFSRWCKVAFDYVSGFDPAMVTTTLFIGCVTLLLLASMYIAAKKEEAEYKKQAAAKNRRKPQPHETAGR